jgi:hypothetical protein
MKQIISAGEQHSGGICGSGERSESADPFVPVHLCTDLQVLKFDGSAEDSDNMSDDRGDSADIAARIQRRR